MDPLLKIMGLMDVAAAIILFLQHWWPLQVLGIFMLIKGLVSLFS